MCSATHGGLITQRGELPTISPIPPNITPPLIPTPHSHFTPYYSSPMPFPPSLLHPDLLLLFYSPPFTHPSPPPPPPPFFHPSPSPYHKFLPTPSPSPNLPPTSNTAPSTPSHHSPTPPRPVNPETGTSPAPPGLFFFALGYGRWRTFFEKAPRRGDC